MEERVKHGGERVEERKRPSGLGGTVPVTTEEVVRREQGRQRSTEDEKAYVGR